MQEFIKWTLDTIREDGASMSWLEESRFEWTAITAQAIRQILEGKTIILITDHKNKWFEYYITNSLNKPSNDRPMIPLVCLDKIYPQYDDITGGEMIDMLDDLLELSFKGEYFFWYVGQGSDRRADIAKRNDESCMWVLDESFQNALTLRSNDELVDIKLIQLYRLFDKTLSATLFGEVDANE